MRKKSVFFSLVITCYLMSFLGLPAAYAVTQPTFSTRLNTLLCSNPSHPFTIGIIGAMQEEASSILKILQHPTTQTIARRTYYSGTLYGIKTIVVFSRWGKVAAASTVTTLFNVFNVNLIIFTGTAGSADPGVNIGDIVIASKLFQHDMDARPLFDEHMVPLLDVIDFFVNQDLLILAEKAANKYLAEDLPHMLSSNILQKYSITQPRVIIGGIASSDKFISSVEKTKEIVRGHINIEAVDMEGAAIAQVSYEYHKPFIVFRSISDNANHESKINFQQFVSEIATHYSLGFIKQLYAEFKENLPCLH